MHGSASLFASSRRSIDIALNSCAIAFVFAIDSSLYGTVLSQREKDSYEGRMQHHPPPLAPHASSSSRMRTAIKTFSFLVYLPDVIMPVYEYYYFVNRASSDPDVAGGSMAALNAG